MAAKKSSLSLEKYLVAKQLAGENASQEEISKYFLDATLAKVIAKYCSKKLFDYLHEKSGEYVMRVRECPSLDEYNISLTDFIKASKTLRFLKITGGVVGALIAAWFFVITFKSENVTHSLILCLSLLFPISVAAGVSALVFQSPYLALSPRIQSCIKYCAALKAYSKKEIEYWQNLTWREFEKETAILLNNLGIDANATRGTGDKGVDIVATYRNKKVLVQCKKHKAPVGPAIVRELLGTLLSENANLGIIISISGFSVGAHEAASGRILLLEIRDLLQLEKSDFQTMLSKIYRF
jgi:restriction system protein